MAGFAARMLVLAAVFALFAAAPPATAANLKTVGVGYCQKYLEGSMSRVFCEKYLGAKKPLEQFCVARNWLVSFAGARAGASCFA